MLPNLFVKLHKLTGSTLTWKRTCDNIYYIYYAYAAYPTVSKGGHVLTNVATEYSHILKNVFLGKHLITNIDISCLATRIIF